LARKSPHPAVPARPRKRGSPRSPREKERRPRRACNSTVKRAKIEGPLVEIGPRSVLAIRRSVAGSSQRGRVCNDLNPLVPAWGVRIVVSSQ